MNATKIQIDDVSKRSIGRLLFKPKKVRDVVQISDDGIDLRGLLNTLSYNKLKSVALSCGCDLGTSKKVRIRNIILSNQIESIQIVTKKKK